MSKNRSLRKSKTGLNKANSILFAGSKLETPRYPTTNKIVNIIAGNNTSLYFMNFFLFPQFPEGTIQKDLNKVCIFTEKV